MNYPSLKTIKKAFPGYDPVAIRALMELDTAVRGYWENKFSTTWRRQFYRKPDIHYQRMLCLNHYLEMHGVAYINPGSNQRSPGIEYLNAGDPYATTIMFINGRFRIGCWGDIVERGNYE